VSEDLLLYAQLGYAQHISRLVAGGVDPDWRREDGVTTLMIAALTGRDAIMEALIDAGATVDLRAPDGTTALLAATAFAQTTRETSGIELLLARGADPNLANVEGNTALMMSARHGLVTAIVALLHAGAATDMQNRYGSTALMQAARGHLIESARVLLRAGADPARVDESGRSARDYAREAGAPLPDLAAMLAPPPAPASARGGPPPASVPPPAQGTSRFEHDHFVLTLIGSWHGVPLALDAVRVVEASGARRIDVEVERLDVELAEGDRHDAVAIRVGELSTAISGEVGPCRFSEVRFAEASGALQARFHAVATGVFFALCLYATPRKVVTLRYRDDRPGLGEEARGRQAGECVATFVVR